MLAGKKKKVRQISMLIFFSIKEKISKENGKKIRKKTKRI
jgi:hypothetical protein